MRIGDVFVNRTLNMKKISHIGLDMDHTLVRYKSMNFEALAHKVMREKLVRDKKYPKMILDLEFDWVRSIRGLVIDRARGNVLKLSRHTAIRQSFHGLKPIPFDEQKRIYKSTYIDLKDRAYDKVDTSFSISYADLYSQLVDVKDNEGAKLLPDYSQIAEDLNVVLDSAHRDGSLKDEVRRNLSHYIVKDPETVRGLERYIKHGKKIFVATNSDYNYSKLLLDYAINPFLKDHKDWSELFTYVIVSARKPDFFFGNAPFQRIDPATGENLENTAILKPGMYVGGSANQMTNDLKLDPDEILYIGDHIYGDIVRLKKDCAWRTALVVEELEDEVKLLKKAQPLSNKINELMAKKVPLEIQIDDLISKRIETKKDVDSKKIEGLIKKSSDIDKKISPLIRKLQKMFNPYWGEVMRVGIEESYFAYQVERYACVYMARLSHLLEISPRTYFRSSKRALPHEIIESD
jgi:HAD superfamily 5'-nucleotidase-like hydrolase